MKPYTCKVEDLILRFKSGVNFATLFGSSARGENDEASDIDILVVSKKELVPSITYAVKSLNRRAEREIHLNIFSDKEFMRRLKMGDYLIASILEDSIPLVGEDHFNKAKEFVFNFRPNESSIEFNKRVGTKLLERAYNEIEMLRRQGNICVTMTYGEHTVWRLLKAIEDLNVALGYLYASDEMVRTRRFMTFKNLLKGQLFRKLYHDKKEIKRKLTSPLSDLDLREINQVISRISKRKLVRPSLAPNF